jgi:16S rRNA (cytidine1402-2'-O)-methyltransferase
VLYVVATPLGNLGDLTSRAVAALESAHVIAAEDTRRTRILVAHLGLEHKELVRLDASASAGDVERVCDRVERGDIVAVVSDAGTPVVSDPGSALVARARERGLRISPLPGPSAVTAALSVSGFGGAGFRFIGFFPRGGRERSVALGELARAAETLVFFESPHRMAETLAAIAEAAPTRRALIARELTKVHEELLAGTLAELAERLGDREWLGELTVVVEASTEPEAAPTATDAAPRVRALLAEGRRARDVAELVALETGLSKRDAYELVLEEKRRAGSGD